MLRQREDDRGEEVIAPSSQVQPRPPKPGNAERAAEIPAERIVEASSAIRLQTLLSVPIATSVGLAIHILVFAREPPVEARSYTLLLSGILGASVVMAVIQRSWLGLRRWMRDMCPILTAVLLLLCFWEVITSGLRLLPLPYFPGPAGVLQSLISDRALLFDSTWHSLILLLGGYALGVLAGLISGICIGWSSPVRYWECRC